MRKLFAAASEPLRLGPDETAIAEVLVRTGDLKHHTIRITYPHNDEGRLVLTNSRLLYLSYDQKRTTLAVSLGEISQVEAGTKKGFLTSSPAVTVFYGQDGRNRRVTFSVPSEMIDYGGAFMTTKRHANRYTADGFSNLLNQERAKPSVSAA